ncbi:MAG TPA: hypothetical protein VGI63_06070 [Verrucomicrobiae bacterium]|jgi:hypothetical protein
MQNWISNLSDWEAVALAMNVFLPVFIAIVGILAYEKKNTFAKRHLGKLLCITFALAAFALIAQFAASVHHNNFRTDIVFKYDDKFESMKKERWKAANELYAHLQKGNLNFLTNAPALDDVLGFFDDLGFYWKNKEVSDEVLYQEFYDSMRTYYQPSQFYITNTQRDEPAAFENIKPLFDRLTEIDAKSKRSKTTIKNCNWSKTDELTALKDEIDKTGK